MTAAALAAASTPPALTMNRRRFMVVTSASREGTADTLGHSALRSRPPSGWTHTPTLSLPSRRHELVVRAFRDARPAGELRGCESRSGPLTAAVGPLHIVRMKKVTASEARKHWFRLLDEAAQGEVIVVQRKGRRVVLRREELNDAGDGAARPEYHRLLHAPGADKADRWSWEWRDAGRGLTSRRAPAR